ncbi:glycosyltransferase family 4 protein [Microbacterium awajiense]|uniref:Glycosyltransferase family 4 protein n=1 Tax=Microbacterium awajiense TaxID=415214 RepID=A0ABP7AVT9_9MICO
MTDAATLAFVVPRGVDDPARVSGGSVFDRRLADALVARGRPVRVVEVGATPAALADVFDDIPDGAPVLIDGLVARAGPDVLERHAGRVRTAVLAHMVTAAFADAAEHEISAERRAFRSASTVIATSDWTQRRLIDDEGVRRERVVVVAPGTDPAPVSLGTPDGAALLCVGTVAPHKGQDVLVEALRGVGTDHPWHCTIVGSVEGSPPFVAHVRTRARRAGIEDRLSFAGVLDRAHLERAYRRADLVVAPSRVESYGMAIAEALRRGIPVVASDVGGIPQAVGVGGAALLVPPDRPDLLGRALGAWLTDPGLRERLTNRARSTRRERPTWSEAAARVDAIVAGLS